MKANHNNKRIRIDCRCVESEYQRYKFWKQITTLSCLILLIALVVSEYQRYKFWKQITTVSQRGFFLIKLYQNIKDINFESKSQQLQPVALVNRLYQNIKDINFESKSQLHKYLYCLFFVVSEYQRYKFWKQITTISVAPLLCLQLYQNIKDINFESKSQLQTSDTMITICCIRISKI